MAFYDLSKQERAELVSEIGKRIFDDLQTSRFNALHSYFADDDTYIRKSAYLSVGRIYTTHSTLQIKIIETLKTLSAEDNFKIRQTVINAAGEIGKHEFENVQEFFDKGLFDIHHSPRNAVIGSIKKMGEVNPLPVLAWAKKYLHHPDKEIRREICHGIELRGRKHPADILPLLRELQFDKTRRVRSTLVHVIGQVAYKKGCIETVVSHLKDWENKELVTEALKEIIDVHRRYRDFAAMSQKQAEKYLLENIPEGL
ncbi:HEAT repeat domain-containing protein [Flavihumibacter sp. R14]|nr:HEAT repeat domain-containing protein [Flavihumibacter soli]